MKRLKLTLLSIMATCCLYAQVAKTNYSNNGAITSVDYSQVDAVSTIPATASEFFNDVLQVTGSDEFIKSDIAVTTGKTESYDQYYNGVRVEGGGYSFHYDKSGKMEFANGNYVDINNLNTIPSISEESALKVLEDHLSAEHIYDSSSELMIKRIKENVYDDQEEGIPMLVYKVFLNANSPIGEVYGYVDAHTGDVLYTTSALSYAVETGTFETIYSGTQYAQTQHINNKYRLYDDCRGAVIHTRNLNGGIFGQSSVYELEDNDNFWYRSEHTNNTDMGMDVHWALQKIYDRLLTGHGINSFNNNGKKIEAYIKANIETEVFGEIEYNTAQAGWDRNYKVLLFGEGDSKDWPHASVDIVAHEFGHGITNYMTNWSNYEEYLDEGFADIWAAIMEYRILGNSDDVWKIGEKVKKTGYPFRDFTSSNHICIATTYQSKYYYNNTDPHERGGVFSHWFYLLVNGGQTINDKGYMYTLTGIGMDIAENLIVKAMYGGYLRYAYTYPQVAVAIENAAQAMGISGLKAKVHDAWCAVGVYDEGVKLSIEGPALIHTDGTYSVKNLPSEFNVFWSINDDYYVNNCIKRNYPSRNQLYVKKDNTKEIYKKTLSADIKRGSKRLNKLSVDISAYSGFKGTYSRNGTTYQINPPLPVFASPGQEIIIDSPNLVGGSVYYQGSPAPTTWVHDSNSGTLKMTLPASGSQVLSVYITDAYGIQQRITVAPLSSTSASQLDVEQTGDEILVTIGSTSDKTYDNESDISPEMKWELEVINVITGQKVLEKTVEGSTAIINKSAWGTGFYTIRATCNKEVINKKIAVQ